MLFDQTLFVIVLSLLVASITILCFYPNAPGPLPSHGMAPFEFGDYPLDVPYELRDVSQFERIIGIGDLHGDLSQTIKVLQMCGVIDNQSNWTANNTILIQTGDIADRGSESIEIYELFFKLRTQAIDSNSLVLQILGNHELLNMNGKYHNVNQQEMYKNGGTSEWAKLWSKQRKLGYFVRNTPIMRVIGSNLFVHAGIKLDYIKMFMDSSESSNNNATSVINEMNGIMRYGLMSDNLNEHDHYKQFYDFLSLTAPNGPLWTRDFDPNSYSQRMLPTMYDKHQMIQEHICEQVDHILDAMDVKRMVIGHNVQSQGVVTTQCQGKLVSIDVGISCYVNCKLGAITIDLETDLLYVLTDPTIYFRSVGL